VREIAEWLDKLGMSECLARARRIDYRAVEHHDDAVGESRTRRVSLGLCRISDSAAKK
jgi:hypothetical protein